MTETTFLLNLTDQAISLERLGQDPNGKVGWFREDSVPLDAPDLGAALGKMRSGVDATSDTTKVLVALPQDQIKVLEFDDETLTDADIASALVAATPYEANELAMDWSRRQGKTVAAAAAHETMVEAKVFLSVHGYDIQGFVALPGGGWGPSFANFGAFPTTGAKLDLPLKNYPRIKEIAAANTVEDDAVKLEAATADETASKVKPPKEAATADETPAAKSEKPAATAPEKPAVKDDGVVTKKSTAATVAAPAIPSKNTKSAKPAPKAAPATAAAPLPPAKKAGKAAAVAAPVVAADTSSSQAEAAVSDADATAASAAEPVFDTRQAQTAQNERRKKFIGVLLTAILLLALFVVAAVAGTAGRDRIAAWLGFGPDTPAPAVFVAVSNIAGSSGGDTGEFEEMPTALVADRLVTLPKTTSIAFPTRLPTATALPEGMPRIFGQDNATTASAPNDPLAGRNLALEAALSELFVQLDSDAASAADLRRYASTGVWTIAPSSPDAVPLARATLNRLEILDQSVQPFSPEQPPALVLQVPDPTPGVGERFVAETTLAGIPTVNATSSQNRELSTPQLTAGASSPALPILGNDETSRTFAPADGTGQDLAPTQGDIVSTFAAAASVATAANGAALVETGAAQSAVNDTTGAIIGDAIAARPSIVPPNRDLTGATIISDGIRVTFAAPAIVPPTRANQATPLGITNGAATSGDANVILAGNVTDTAGNAPLASETQNLASDDSAANTTQTEGVDVATQTTNDVQDDGPGFGLAPELATAPTLRPGTPEASITPEVPNQTAQQQPSEDQPATDASDLANAQTEDQATDTETADQLASADLSDDGPGFGLAPETANTPPLRDVPEADEDPLDTVEIEEGLPAVRPSLRPNTLAVIEEETSNWSPQELLALSKVRPAPRPRGLASAPKPKEPEPKPEPESTETAETNAAAAAKAAEEKAAAEAKAKAEATAKAEAAAKAKAEADAQATAKAEAEAEASAAALAAKAAAANKAEALAAAAASSRRPAARPKSVERAAARSAPKPKATAKAPAKSAEPKAEPRSSGRVVVARRNEIAKPSGAVSRTVQKNATVANVVNLRRITLIGISGSSKAPRALIRFPNGNFQTVKVGDRLDGGRVASIGNKQVRYVKSGRSITLKMPRT